MFCVFAIYNSSYLSPQPVPKPLFCDNKALRPYRIQLFTQPVDVVKQVLPKAQLKPDLLRMKASQLIIDAAEIIMEESGK